MNEKIISQKEAIEISERLRKEGKTIVATNGCFDLIHAAHIKILQKAKALGDKLIILLNSDSSIKSFKSEDRPIISQDERATLLAALECVDYVTIFNEDDPDELISKIKPHKVAKGGTFIPEKIAQHKKTLANFGGEFVNFPLEEGFSSTDIITKIINASTNKNSQEKSQ